ncbi:MAG: PIN domain-containing protein [bacterium]
MGKLTLLDTGVWVACFLQEDIFHAEADQLIRRLISAQTIIVVPEILRAEVLNIVLRESLDKNRLKSINERFWSMAPGVQFRHGGIQFWNEFVPEQLSRLFLQTMDFLVACYTLYWEVEAFFSFDEKLNKAMRRIKPEIVKLKIRRGRVIEV